MSGCRRHGPRLFLLNAVQVLDQHENTGAYVGFLSIRKIDKLFSGIDRVSLTPNRHVTWTVTGDVHTSVDHHAYALSRKYSPIVLGKHRQVWWHDLQNFIKNSVAL